MDKYVEYDTSNKKAVACVVQQGKVDAYRTLDTGMRLFSTMEYLKYRF